MSTSPPFPLLTDTLDRAHQLAHHEGHRLDQPQFELDDAHERHSGPGVCWRVEARTLISDPTDKVLCRWHAGERTRAVNELAGERDELAARYLVYRSQHLDIRTLWVPHLPLTRHGEFLAHVFRVQARAGFQVAVAAPGTALPSLLVYPGRHFYFLHHTAQGRPHGATRVNAPRPATALADHIEAVARDGQGIHAFTRRQL
ncbi:DUF6879 family protein [Nocardiopsis changdeensis]|uniref:DUF6879 domain-containing protein n=1 Tax=Nocardiopsis changdeensis TaxID=2831969 RepID=A0ABX8BGX2_9ACTN|nr:MULTISPECIES: DUF6879 family protein [Nocardiopsis]QUX20609.1 hypothetical protein KGD84_19090 [Nocardiopsis changdeensis]QYX36540.1 hypothetical protein K1J57_28545 [Nocardiopsis sp. MT53]